MTFELKLIMIYDIRKEGGENTSVGEIIISLRNYKKVSMSGFRSRVVL